MSLVLGLGPQSFTTKRVCKFQLDPIPALSFLGEYISLYTSSSARFNLIEIVNDVDLNTMTAFYNVYVTTDDWTTYQEVLFGTTYPTATGTTSHQLASPVEAKTIAVGFLRVGDGMNVVPDRYVRVDEIRFTLV